jgi:hypothetical protein
MRVASWSDSGRSPKVSLEYIICIVRVNPHRASLSRSPLLYRWVNVKRVGGFVGSGKDRLWSLGRPPLIVIHSHPGWRRKRRGEEENGFQSRLDGECD